METWAVLRDVTDQTNWGGLEQREYYMDNTNAYQYYKFNCTELVSSTATGLSCSEMAFCNLNIWTQYTEAVDTLIMPVMTSNPQDGYTLSASTTQEGNVLNLFKQNGTADWWVAGNSAFPCTVTVQSEAAFICNLIKLQARPSYYEQSPSEFYLEGSNDEEEWTQLYYSPTQSSWGSGEIRSFYFENETAYTHYRIRGLSAVGSGYFAMSTMNLYQRTFIVHPAS